MSEVLAPLTKPPITPEQLREYAEASGDNNPIHLEPKFAQEAGFPSVIAHGMLSMGFLGDYLRHHFPENRFRVLKFRTRFRKVVFPGDSLTCEGKIRDGETSGKFSVSLQVRNAAGEVTADGSADLQAL